MAAPGAQRLLAVFSAASTSAKAGFFHAPVPADTRTDNYDFHGLIQTAAGFPFACEFDHVGFWDLRVALPRSIASARLHCRGPAHSHPPYGAVRAHNGLEDVANLGWKLAAMFEAGAATRSWILKARSVIPILPGDRRGISSPGASAGTRIPRPLYSPERNREES